MTSAGELMNWVLMPFRRVLDYSGRSRRREYWLFALFALVLVLLVGRLPQAISNNFGSLLIIGLAVPGLAVTVRRLHDVGRSGWWIAMPIVPFLFWAVALVGGFSSEVLFHVIMPIVILAPFALAALLLFDGNRGPNAYGPDPKNLPEGL